MAKRGRKKSTDVNLVDRKIVVKAFPYWGEYYLRTRDVANYIGVKQPFAFTEDIKDVLGYEKILKYEDAAGFRQKEDLPTTTFISARDLYTYLIGVENKKYKTNNKYKAKLIASLCDII